MIERKTNTQSVKSQHLIPKTLPTPHPNPALLLLLPPPPPLQLQHRLTRGQCIIDCELRYVYAVDKLLLCRAASKISEQCLAQECIPTSPSHSVPPLRPSKFQCQPGLQPVTVKSLVPVFAIVLPIIIFCFQNHSTNAARQISQLTYYSPNITRKHHPTLDRP